MDKRIVFLFGLIVAVASNNDSKNEKTVRGKIVGGTAVKIEAAPYQVSLSQATKGHFCGGALISPMFVLTAAHCVDKMSASSLFIRTGSTEVNKGGSIVPVAAIHRHPRFSRTTVDSDIALVQLRNAIPNPKMIALADREPIAGEYALITGWGVASEQHKTPSRYLNHAWVPVIDRASCKAAYSLLNPITVNMVCAGYKEGGYDACQGDSGGPMVVNNRLAGVVSWGRGCGRRNTPGVYTNVVAFRSWIRSIAGV